MHLLAALVFSKELTANKGNVDNKLVAAVADRQEEEELLVGNYLQYEMFIGVVLAFNNNLVVG
jgi:hypothetical protein